MVQDPNTHLYPLQMNYQQGGDGVGQAQIKIGEQAQTLDSLLTVYDHIRIPQILTAVKAAVDEMYNPALGLQDALNGGFFYSVDFDGKGLQSAYKESRQGWMVQLLGHLNANLDTRTAAGAETLFNKTRAAISRASDGEQVPSVSSSLAEDVPLSATETTGG